MFISLLPGYKATLVPDTTFPSSQPPVHWLLVHMVMEHWVGLMNELVLCPESGHILE